MFSALDDKVDRNVLSGGLTPATIGNTTITKVHPPGGTITLEPDEEERDEADGDDEDLEPNSSEDVNTLTNLNVIYIFFQKTNNLFFRRKQKIMRRIYLMKPRLRLQNLQNLLQNL